MTFFPLLFFQRDNFSYKIEEKKDKLFKERVRVGEKSSSFYCFKSQSSSKPNDLQFFFFFGYVSLS